MINPKPIRHYLQGSYSSSHGTLFSNIAGGPPLEEVDVQGRLWVIAGGNVCGHR
jgi:hypothetical protein